jgi:hypothetical protein
LIAFQYDIPVDTKPKMSLLMMGPDDIVRLKELIATTPKGEVFEYRGVPILREYAVYLVQFLEKKFQDMCDQEGA